MSRSKRAMVKSRTACTVISGPTEGSALLRTFPRWRARPTQHIRIAQAFGTGSTLRAPAASFGGITLKVQALGATATLLHTRTGRDRSSQSTQENGEHNDKTKETNV